ncbi:MAG TPA: hypothetical protein PKH36_16085 [Flavobacteriales bacterium]|nr:hypothetical protein [Flavobacteriales bacterium]
MRAAVIDLGTNTFNLLVYHRTPQLNVVHSEELPVFLGRGGMQRGANTDEALEQGMVVLARFAEKARASGAEHITGIGTSALRNARNAHVLVERAWQELGITVTVIPGHEEAELILEGVRQAVSFGTRPMLVMDVGGGSIEFILATNKALMWKRSFEIGVTRLRDRFIVSDPISLDDHFRLSAYLDAQLEPLFAVMDRHWPTALVGSAGSFDTLASIVAAARGEDLIEALTLNLRDEEIDPIRTSIMGMSRAERLRVQGLPEHRVDTIQPALVVLERVMLHGIEEIRWSRYALKEGAAMRNPIA